ncbi:hypothetical protein QC334_34805 [Streptomyces sp. DH18]|uniref:hypothetical protein n=1 Tax=Streptomyces sp. DH18 TaxID=3040126 RepID=UPI0024416C05|nr:hypothetical protein [Streptomyces sp. DH18]MDG9687842.1 hypothetical protein [Streptomyces sp. DH18]
MSTSPTPTTHDYGPDKRQRGNDYSVYSFDRTPDGARFYVSGHAHPGDAIIRRGDEVTISPPGGGRGRACRVVEVTYSGALWDAVLDMPDPTPERPHEPGARPAPLSRLLYP